MQRIHVARPAREVHRQDRARARRDRAPTSSGSMFMVDRIDVGEHRRRAGVNDRVDGRAEGQRRRDHLVARPEPAARSERCSAAVHEFTATACAAPLYAREVLFEPRDLRPGAEPSRIACSRRPPGSRRPRWPARRTRGTDPSIELGRSPRHAPTTLPWRDPNTRQPCGDPSSSPVGGPGLYGGVPAPPRNRPAITALPPAVWSTVTRTSRRPGR